MCSSDLPAPSAVTPVTAGAVTTAPSVPPSTPPIASPPAPRVSRLSQVSPSLLVTLIGVVVLGVASFVSAHEHDPLVSLSHGTRLSVLGIELIAAAAATFYLMNRRATLADAFGSLTWAAGLSLALLATVDVRTGLIPVTWTYSIPFIVALPTVVVSRRHLPITRFLSIGTLLYGVWNLSLYGLSGSENELFRFVPMVRGVVVMVLVAVVCATILWVAHSDNSGRFTTPERFLSYIGIAFLYGATISAPLPPARTVTTAILATIGVLSMALPFVAGALALRRRESSDARIGRSEEHHV